MVGEIQSTESEINKAVTRNCTPNFQASHATLMTWTVRDGGKKGDREYMMCSIYVACNLAIAFVSSGDKNSLSTRRPQVNIIVSRPDTGIGRDTAE